MHSLARMLALAIAVVSLSGCGIFNDRHASPEATIIQSDSLLPSVKPAFLTVRNFRVRVTPLEPGRLDAEFLAITVSQNILQTASSLNLALSSCSKCPAGSIVLDFRQHPERSAVHRVFRKNSIAGTLYLVKNSTVIDKIPIDGALDQENLARLIEVAVSARLVKTASVRLVSDYQFGRISDQEWAARTETLLEHMRDPLARNLAD